MYSGGPLRCIYVQRRTAVERNNACTISHERLAAVKKQRIAADRCQITTEQSAANRCQRNNYWNVSFKRPIIAIENWNGSFKRIIIAIENWNVSFKRPIRYKTSISGEPLSTKQRTISGAPYIYDFHALRDGKSTAATSKAPARASRTLGQILRASRTFGLAPQLPIVCAPHAPR
jgi:hypothetical protein